MPCVANNDWLSSGRKSITCNDVHQDPKRHMPLLGHTLLIHSDFIAWLKYVWRIKMKLYLKVRELLFWTTPTRYYCAAHSCFDPVYEKQCADSIWRSRLAINSSPHSAACMHQRFRSALVQLMACRLFGTKTLSKSMLGYRQLGP